MMPHPSSDSPSIQNPYSITSKGNNEAGHILIQTFNSNPTKSIGHAYNQNLVRQQKTN